MTETKKVLIFTGAGMGVPLGLPAASGFVDGVTTGAQVITRIAQIYLGDPIQNDIEWVLATLESFRKEARFTETILHHLINPIDPQARKSALDQWENFKNQASSELVRIKKLIFQRLVHFDVSQAVSLYGALIGEIREKYPQSAISIITTNYDLTFESAAEHAPAMVEDLGINEIEFGFSLKNGRPIYDSSRDWQWNSDTLEFLKIHGSLDWNRDVSGNYSRSMSTTIPDDPDKMAILYPGFKGVPEGEPFISLHGRLSQRLSEADIVVVIGFAFRDSLINSMFENVLRNRRDLDVLYFNPLAVESHPKNSVAPGFIKLYPRFIHYCSGIEIRDKPLNFP